MFSKLLEFLDLNYIFVEKIIIIFLARAKDYIGWVQMHNFIPENEELRT